jgi:hypothetical protein
VAGALTFLAVHLSILVGMIWHVYDTASVQPLLNYYLCADLVFQLGGWTYLDLHLPVRLSFHEKDHVHSTGMAWYAD